MKGSAGSGKSQDVAQMYILMLADPAYKGANLLALRKIAESNRDSTYAELTGAVRRIYGEYADSVWRSTENPMRMRCLTTGNEIIFRGMNDIHQREKVKSINFTTGKLAWIWMEEATEFEADDLEILDDRLRGELPNPNLYYQLTGTFNPVRSDHWIKSRFFDYQDADTFTHHSTYLDNLFCDAAFNRRMERRRILDPDGYRVYGLGEWGETGGMILTRWRLADFDRSPERFDHRILSQDFGYNHANVLGEIGFKDGDLFVCRELYEFEKSTDELIRLANQAGFDKSLQMWCDSAEPDRIKMWQADGWRARGVKKEPGSVKAQIDYLQQRTIWIHPSCPNTAKEAGAWKWKKDRVTGKYTDEPVEIFDDAMAMLRYAIEDVRNPASAPTAFRIKM
jgi:phage terminase large subunit